jgi:hypothetical protein
VGPGGIPEPWETRRRVLGRLSRTGRPNYPADRECVARNYLPTFERKLWPAGPSAAAHRSVLARSSWKTNSWDFRPRGSGPEKVRASAIIRPSNPVRFPREKPVRWISRRHIRPAGRGRSDLARFEWRPFPEVPLRPPGYYNTNLRGADSEKVGQLGTLHDLVGRTCGPVAMAGITIPWRPAGRSSWVPGP